MMTEQQLVKAGQRWQAPNGEIVEVLSVHNTSVSDVELRNVRTGRRYWKGSGAMIKNYKLQASKDDD